MELYFLRHGIAFERGEGDYSEEERPLTPEGIKKMKKAAKGLRRLDPGFTRIFSSPLVRARQTAEIAAEEMGISGKIEFVDWLKPEADFVRFVKGIRNHAADEKLLFVGHQPSMGNFVSSLISEEGLALMDFKKGSLCLVELIAPADGAKPAGQLQWLLTPRQLRLLA